MKLDVVRSPAIRVAAEQLDDPRIYDRALARLFMGRDLSAPEVGCALAHRLVYRELVKSPEDYCLVFEDDARLRDAVSPEDLAATLNVKWPRVIMLHANARSAVDAGPVVGVQPARSADHALRQLACAPTTTTGYAINRQAALAMLSGGAAISSVADWPADSAHKIEFVAIVPWPCSAEDNEVSLIKSSRDSAQVHAQGGRRDRLQRVIRNALVNLGVLRGVSHAFIAHRVIRRLLFLVAQRFGGPSELPAIGGSLFRLPSPLAELVRMQVRIRRQLLRSSNG